MHTHTQLNFTGITGRLAQLMAPRICMYVLDVYCFSRWSAGTIYITVYRNLVLALLLTTIVFLIGIDRTEPPVNVHAYHKQHTLF